MSAQLTTSKLVVDPLSNYIVAIEILCPIIDLLLNAFVTLSIVRL